MTEVSLEWKPGVLRVAVMGQVWNDAFGLRTNRERRWVVAHLPTGFNCGTFDDEPTAKKYVEHIGFHHSWKEVRVGPDGTAHVPGELAAFCQNILHKFTAERTIL